MYARTCLTIILLVITTISSCKTKEEPITPEVAAQEAGLEEEKLAILNTLNNETKAAFQRDYEAWQQYWVHDSTITKTYLDFPENTFSESLGWAKIDQFVKGVYIISINLKVNITLLKVCVIEVYDFEVSLILLITGE